MTFDSTDHDPPRDFKFPATNAAVTFESTDARVLGLLHLAAGAEPHPTILLLHGIPGYERNFDLAQAVRRAGWNALVFHYRGAWGSPGAFSFQHVLDDTRAALAFLREPRARELYRVEIDRIVLLGHSLGAFAALTTALADSQIRAVISLALYDLGAIANACHNAAYAEATRQFFEWGMPPLRDTSPQALLDELMTHGANWHLPQYAATLAERQLLLVDAAQDRIAPAVLHHAPLAQALQEAHARAITQLTFDTDHAFCDHRIALARTIIEWLDRTGSK